MPSWSTWASTINSKEVRRRLISLRQNDRSFKVNCEEGTQHQFLDDDALYFAKMGLLGCRIDAWAPLWLDRKASWKPRKACRLTTFYQDSSLLPWMTGDQGYGIPRIPREQTSLREQRTPASQSKRQSREVTLRLPDKLNDKHSPRCLLH